MPFHLHAVNLFAFLFGDLLNFDDFGVIRGCMLLAYLTTLPAASAGSHRPPYKLLSSSLAGEKDVILKGKGKTFIFVSEIGSM